MRYTNIMQCFMSLFATASPVVLRHVQPGLLAGLLDPCLPKSVSLSHCQQMWSLNRVYVGFWGLWERDISEQWSLWVCVHTKCNRITFKVFVTLRRVEHQRLGRTTSLDAWHSSWKKSNFSSDTASCCYGTANPRREHQSVTCWLRISRGLSHAKQFMVLKTSQWRKQIIKNDGDDDDYYFFKVGSAQHEVLLLQEAVVLTELILAPQASMHPEPTLASSSQLLTLHCR